MSELITELYGESSSPYLKAADNAGLNKAVKIKSAMKDEAEFDGKVDKFISIEVGAEKPIKLSRTNAKTLVGEFSDDLGAWVGRKIILQTKEYNFTGSVTIGWVTIPMPANEPDDDIPF